MVPQVALQRQPLGRICSPRKTVSSRDSEGLIAHQSPKNAESHIGEPFSSGSPIQKNEDSRIPNVNQDTDVLDTDEEHLLRTDPHATLGFDSPDAVDVSLRRDLWTLNPFPHSTEVTQSSHHSPRSSYPARHSPLLGSVAPLGGVSDSPDTSREIFDEELAPAVFNAFNY